MPKFRVRKGHDAWVIYEAIVEADSIEDANDFISWNSSQAEIDWRRNGEIDEFDHFDTFPDETEEVKDGDEVEGKLILAVSPEERNTILAALRAYQQVSEQCAGDLPDDLYDIATNGGAHDALDLEAIDNICERINV
jgi:hypothetical protein